MSEVTRAEHLAWCKRRALQYVEMGDVKQAFASFSSDIRKHPETRDLEQVVGMLGLPMLMNGFLNSPEAMRDHINGYN